MSELDPDKIGVTVRCTVCDRVKHPRGRSALFDMDLCDRDCDGYEEEPYPGQLWPGESETDFGYWVGNDGTRIR